MIDRTRLCAGYLIASHPPCEMAGQGGKRSTAAASIAMLKISDHECRSARQGNF
jgi:hypothetical protein